MDNLEIGSRGVYNEWRNVGNICLEFMMWNIVWSTLDM